MKHVLEYEAPAPAMAAPKMKYRYDQGEREFESRLEDLNGRLDGLHNEISLVWINGEPHVHDVALDLKIKIEAVRWMLRVCKHLEEPARERVFLTVGESLEKLERAFESQPQPKRKSTFWF